jgi:hypothetical protein
MTDGEGFFSSLHSVLWELASSMSGNSRQRHHGMNRIHLLIIATADRSHRATGDEIVIISSGTPSGIQAMPFVTPVSQSVT